MNGVIKPSIYFTDKRLEVLLDEIRRVSSMLKLDSNIEMKALDLAQELYKDGVVGKIGERDLLVLDAFAIVYVTCKLNEVVIGYKKLIKNIRKVSIRVKKIRKNLNKRVKKIVQSIRPKEYKNNIYLYVEHLAKEAFLSDRVLKSAKKITKKIVEEKLHVGRDPNAIASAILYVASILEGEKITEKKMSSIAGISEVTLRKRVREIIMKL